MIEYDDPPIRLTERTTCGGCATKLGADALAEALAGIRRWVVGHVEAAPTAGVTLT